MNNQKFVNKLGAYEVKINKVIKKDATQKAKASYYLEFITKDGAIVSQRFNRPFVDFDYSKAARLMSLWKGAIDKETAKRGGEARVISALESLVNKECVVLVTATEWKQKTFFQVAEVLPHSFTQYLEDSKNDHDFFNDNVDAALSAFEGATVKEDQDLPF